MNFRSWDRAHRVEGRLVSLTTRLKWAFNSQGPAFTALFHAIHPTGSCVHVSRILHDIYMMRIRHIISTWQWKLIFKKYMVHIYGFLRRLELSNMCSHHNAFWTCFYKKCAHNNSLAIIWEVLTGWNICGC